MQKRSYFIIRKNDELEFLIPLKLDAFHPQRTYNLHHEQFQLIDYRIQEYRYTR